MFIKTALFAAKNTLLALPRGIAYGIEGGWRFTRLALNTNGNAPLLRGAATLGAATILPPALILTATFSAFAKIPAQTRKDLRARKIKAQQKI